MASTTSISASLDMRGKTITTYIAYEAAQRLRTLAEGDTLELLTGTGDAIGNDIGAWCHATGHQPASTASAGTHCRYVIIKGALQRPGKSLAPGGRRCVLVLPGSGSRVLAKGFTEKLHGWRRPFSRFARAGLAKTGHVPAAEKIRQLQALGARLYLCGPSMQHFRMKQADIAFSDVTIAEYLTFAEAMTSADIHLFVQ